VVGVDLDPRVMQNPLLDEGVVADITDLPFADNSFDLAFSIFVLEHLPDPAKMVRELRRVLRPGGLFLAITPNRYHYVAMISALTPVSFHKWFNKRRGRAEDDTFPTCYRLNSRRDVRQALVPQFQIEELTMIEVQPNYLTFSTPTFLLGAAYERLVNSTSWLAGFRVNIIMALRNSSKTTEPAGTADDAQHIYSHSTTELAR
jgi:SAM-dependent methyltransferase